MDRKCRMLRFLAAVAVILGVLTAAALLVAAMVWRAAPLAARLEARWARRTGAAGTAGRGDREAAESAGGDPNAMLAAMQGDGLSADCDPSAGGGDGGAGVFMDGGGSGDGGAAGGGDGG